MSSFTDAASRVERACDFFDRRAAAQASAELAAEIRSGKRVFEADLAMKSLKRLRKNRYFEAALDVAEAVLQTGQTDNLVRAIYAQALIDSGHLIAALSFLSEVFPSVTRGSVGENEVCGLIGRTYKQLFVESAGEAALREDRLRRAFDTYYDAYVDAPERYWHGINAVALLARAEKEQMTLRRIAPFAETIFRQTAALAESSNADPWPMATAAEAALALGDFEESRKRYGLFASFDRTIVGAFEIYSALRQLIEVWGLTDDQEPGATLLPLLRAAYLDRSGGDVAFEGEGLRRNVERVSSLLEKTFSETMFKTLRWYRSGLERCNPVCRINDPQGAGIGTGFVVRGGEFNDGLGDDKFVLTNAHVLSNSYPNALVAGDATATFEALGDPGEYTLEHIVWSDSQLDATLARASKPLPTCETYKIANKLPLNDQKQRVYVIGHPNGAGLSLSLNDNVLLDYDDKVVHYRAPTEGGSSGSPVFNADWKLIALHHMGDFNARRLNGLAGTYAANEGIRIDRIIETTKKAKMI